MVATKQRRNSPARTVDLSHRLSAAPSKRFGSPSAVRAPPKWVPAFLAADLDVHRPENHALAAADGSLALLEEMERWC